MRELYQRTRPKRLARARDYYKKNTDKKRAYSRAYHAKHRERIRRELSARGQWLKSEAFEAYGGAICRCCEEALKGFLTIDHIDGVTKVERKRQGLGTVLYQWLRSHNYPAGFQVLCYNCNLGRAHNDGVCPHAVPSH